MPVNGSLYNSRNGTFHARCILPPLFKKKSKPETEPRGPKESIFVRLEAADRSERQFCCSELCEANHRNLELLEPQGPVSPVPHFTGRTDQSCWFLHSDIHSGARLCTPVLCQKKTTRFPRELHWALFTAPPPRASCKTSRPRTAPWGRFQAPSVHHSPSISQVRTGPILLSLFLPHILAAIFTGRSPAPAPHTLGSNGVLEVHKLGGRDQSQPQGPVTYVPSEGLLLPPS